jgi:hypothetical protein
VGDHVLGVHGRLKDLEPLRAQAWSRKAGQVWRVLVDRLARKLAFTWLDCSPITWLARGTYAALNTNADFCRGFSHDGRKDLRKNCSHE